MAWRIGIDEAGYGPNLGPLVMTAVACRAPEDHVETDAWRLLAGAVRRAADVENRSRMLVDDSKLVYSTARGLIDLETSVLGILSPVVGSEATLAALVDHLHPQHELRDEAWYRGTTSVPLAAVPATLAAYGDAFHTASQSCGLDWRLFRCVIVCPPRFNAMIDRSGTKAAALGLGLSQMLHAALALAPAEAVTVVADKHGGRHCYGPLLHEAFPDCWPLPREEGMTRSVYDIKGLDRPVRVTFQPRADSEHFEVALASMVSKYVREALMAEFNAFWRLHVPDLKPTAGYPVDAARFMQAIRPALARLNIAEERVWRKR